MSPSDLKQLETPPWIDPDRQGAPTLMLFSAVDDRSGVAYQEYRCVYGEDVETALRFLFNTMSVKPQQDNPLQGIPAALYLDNGPVGKSEVFTGLWGPASGMPATGPGWGKPKGTSTAKPRADASAVTPGCSAAKRERAAAVRLERQERDEPMLHVLLSLMRNAESQMVQVWAADRVLTIIERSLKSTRNRVGRRGALR